MINGLPMRIPVRICIGICTFQRPLLLSRCLASVNRLEEPEDCRIEVIVVDNEEEPAAREFVTALEPRSDTHRLHYVHEPRRGISHARNAILDKAEELGAAWIVMLDDDQIVSWDWLLKMWSAWQTTSANIVQSTVVQHYAASAWAMPERESHSWKHGLRTAAANGVLFPTRLRDWSGAPLRFDVEYNLTGGEDRDFFSRAYLAGAKIVQTPDAVAREFVPETKFTFIEQVRRSFWTSIIHNRQDRRINYSAYTLCLGFVEAGMCFFIGFIQLLASPIFMLGDAYYGRWQCLDAARKLARAGGFVASLISSIRPEPFRTIHGS